MDPMLVLASAVACVAFAVLLHGLAGILAGRAPSPAPSPPPVPAGKAAPGPSPGLATLEGFAADPAVQAVLVGLLEALDARLEAKAADPAVRQFEHLAFGVVINRLKAADPVPAPTPAPKPSAA